MKNLRLAISADWHLSDWSQFSEIDGTGRPSRLLQYNELAKDFVKFAKDNKADCAIIAGDIVDQFGVLKPMVSDVLDSVITTISEKFPLFITHGQHDINTKSEEIASYHSALSRFKSKNNVSYASVPVQYTIDKYTLLIAPWNSEHSIPTDLVGDIFIGHGAVQGSTNLEGYKFSSGFNQEELFKRFRLSIIGDIHNGQVFRNTEERKILIPGTPIQFNYKDSPVCGFWLCELMPGDVNCEFVPIERIHPDFYHRFLLTTDEKATSSRLIHYRYKPEKVSKEKISKSEFKRDTTSIIDIGLEIIKQSKISNQDEIAKQFRSLMDGLSSSDRKVPRSRLLYLNIQGFLSIEELSLEMKEFPDNLVLVGKNGHGKTALVEAIYWALCGKTTKGVSANDIINWYGNGECVVKLGIEVEGVIYQITRWRKNGVPGLELNVWSPD
jgi:DNA repair exonuclease SbcCD nuclease subunit